MTILQAGYPKSGNFWLYRILQDGMARAGKPRSNFITSHPLFLKSAMLTVSVEGQQEIDVLDIDPSGCHFRIGFTLRERVKDLDGYLARATHVWTHSPLLSRSLPIYRRFDPIIYVIRDPRDVAISMSRFAFTPYMLKNAPSGERNPETYLQNRLEEILRDWVRHVSGYLRHTQLLGIHVVYYERLLADFRRETGPLFDRLGFRLTPSQESSLESATSFASMQNTNQGHLRQGKAGGWWNILSPKQARAVDEIAGQMLELLGYPLSHQVQSGNEEAAGAVAPSLGGSPLNLEAIERAERKSERSLGGKARFVVRFLAGPRPFPEKIAVARRLLSKPGELLWKLR